MAYEIGKRFECQECGTKVLVAKPSKEGELSCCGQAMALSEPKQLASSD